jgi:hypothetical protein
MFLHRFAESTPKSHGSVYIAPQGLHRFASFTSLRIFLSASHLLERLASFSSLGVVYIASQRLHRLAAFTSLLHRFHRFASFTPLRRVCTSIPAQEINRLFPG